MKHVVCTLYEGHYHYGVAALVNSLFANDFVGDIFIGYRGELPFWANQAKQNEKLGWENGRTLEPAPGLYLHFLPLVTNYHLTNFKPNFILELHKGPAKDAEGIFYFDPDIIVKCNWAVYPKWIKHGVALVHEILSNDMPPTHPLRGEWQRVIRDAGKNTTRQIHSYINGGFIGLMASNIKFIEDWLLIMNIGHQNYGLSLDRFMPGDRSHLFFASDQDALNVTAMCSEVPISEVGPEGMDFIPGGIHMSHAVGTPKPWKKGFLGSAFKGNPPSLSEKLYWKHVNTPIALYSKGALKKQQMLIPLSALIGRFYSKN